MSTVLIVDDEPAICWALRRALSQEGHEVQTAASAEEGLAAVQVQPPDVILLDVRLPGADGLTTLERLRASGGEAQVIVMTAFGNLDTAVRAIHRGAYEYLAKPFDLDDAISLVRRAMNDRDRPDAASFCSESEDGEGMLLGRSAVMQEVFRKIALAAEHDVPVLISGESGTGKELAATAIHRYSRRASGPFLPICIPALSEALVESELFGHVQGAFTGAQAERNGLLQAANGGTAFLDEIGDVSLPTQAKLLRVLETKSVTPVGSNKSQQTDFRLLAATNRNLEQMVSSGEFREDLYYRLNVFRIHLPPLRERGDDVILLARSFLARVGAQRRLDFTSEALAELARRPWYGNARELRHAVEHAAIVSRSDHIGLESLPPPHAAHSPSGSHSLVLSSAVESWLRTLPLENGEAAAPGTYERLLQHVEPILMKHALDHADGNRSEAARLLGIHRQTLREKLRRYGLDEAEG